MCALPLPLPPCPAAALEQSNVVPETASSCKAACDWLLSLLATDGDVYADGGPISPPVSRAASLRLVTHCRMALAAAQPDAAAEHLAASAPARARAYVGARVWCVGECAWGASELCVCVCVCV